MHTRLVKPRHGPELLVRPLRRGDVATVLAVFERLGDDSRRTRFHGPKPCLSPVELEQLATIDHSHHALVAYVEGDPIAPNRCTPKASSRTTSSDHFSPITERAASTEQGRGTMDAVCQKWVDFSNSLG